MDAPPRTGRRRGITAKQATSDERLPERAHGLGFAGLEDYLPARHGAAWSAAQISAELAVAHEKTARLLGSLGLLGRSGRPTPCGWRRCAGWAPATWLTSCATSPPAACRSGQRRALGNSTPWLAIRARRAGLADLLLLGSTAEQRAEATAEQAGFADLPGFLRPPSRRRLHQRAPVGRDGACMRSDWQRCSGTAAPPSAPLGCAPAAGVGRVGFPDLRSCAQARTAQGSRCSRMSGELGYSNTRLARRLRAHDLGRCIGPPATGRANPPSDGASLLRTSSA